MFVKSSGYGPSLLSSQISDHCQIARQSPVIFLHSTWTTCKRSSLLARKCLGKQLKTNTEVPIPEFNMQRRISPLSLRPSQYDRRLIYCFIRWGFSQLSLAVCKHFTISNPEPNITWTRNSDVQFNFLFFLFSFSHHLDHCRRRSTSVLFLAHARLIWTSWHHFRLYRPPFFTSLPDTVSFLQKKLISCKDSKKTNNHPIFRILPLLSSA